MLWLFTLGLHVHVACNPGFGRIRARSLSLFTDPSKHGRAKGAGALCTRDPQARRAHAPVADVTRKLPFQQL